MGVPRFSVFAVDSAKPEGDEGVTTFTFVVTREGRARGEQTIEWDVAGRGRNPADADDFGGAFPGGMLTFAAGERAKIITVEVTGDRTPFEGDEQFAVRLSGDPQEVRFEKRAARATILDDDILVTTLAIGEEDDWPTLVKGEEGEVTTLAIGEEDQATTLAIGEEGEDPGPIYTTLAIGEESEEPIFTTLAIGEEGEDPGPIYTTMAIGEESDEPVYTTLAIGEEGGPDPIITTHAMGEEGEEAQRDASSSEDLSLFGV
jgi:hypothetical protein